MQLAFADDAHPVGHLLGLLDIMGGEDDGDAAFAKLAHHLPHVAPQLDVDARGGLVQEQDLGLVGERLGDHHPALHAAGQFLDLGVALLPERKLLQHLFDMGGVRGRSEQAAAERHRIPHTLELVGVELLRNQPDLGSGGPVIAHDVGAGDQHLARAWPDDAADDADQGGLARSVRPEQREYLACLISRSIGFSASWPEA
jgi:hypothetical protein